jgi:hypothetical protein
MSVFRVNRASLSQCQNKMLVKGGIVDVFVVSAQPHFLAAVEPRRHCRLPLADVAAMDSIADRK